MTQTIASIRDIAHQFDGFIIDQFGVLHDGQRPYPKALDTLDYLISQGHRIVIVSNSGKRSHTNIKRMSQLGFERHLYTEFVTSGDVAFHLIQEQFSAAEPIPCLLISRDNDQSAVTGLNLQLVQSAASAQLVIIAGSEGDIYEESYYSEMLQDAARQSIPCLCTNPDKWMLTPQGLKFGAGRIAELYELAGGTVQWIGKPYPQIYRLALSHLPNTKPEKLLCIGDSIEHDIQGGLDANMQTLFVKGGIHQAMSNSQLKDFMALHQAQPQYQIAYFS